MIHKQNNIIFIFIITITLLIIYQKYNKNKKKENLNTQIPLYDINESGPIYKIRGKSVHSIGRETQLPESIIFDNLALIGLANPVGILTIIGYAIDNAIKKDRDKKKFNVSSYPSGLNYGVHINDSILTSKNYKYYKNPGLLIFPNTIYYDNKTIIQNDITNFKTLKKFINTKCYSLKNGYINSIFLPGIYNISLLKKHDMDYSNLYQTYRNFIVLPGYDVIFIQSGDYLYFAPGRDIYTSPRINNFNMRVQNISNKPILFEYDRGSQNKWNIVNTNFTINQSDLNLWSSYKNLSKTNPINKSWSAYNSMSINNNEIQMMSWENAERTVKITFGYMMNDLYNKPEYGHFEGILVRVADRILDIYC